MFTGIIEEIGIIKEIHTLGSNKTFYIESSIAKELKKGDSVSHNGVCLTVENVLNEKSYQTTAVAETLSKTNLGYLEVNHKINLERSIAANQRMDGHFVQGHIDCTGRIIEKKDRDGSWEFKIAYPIKFRNLVVLHGSIAIDGISLTISNLEDTRFQENYKEFSFFYVNIIPFTFYHTNVQDWQINTIVNLEFDLLGKYIQRFLENKKN